MIRRMVFTGALVFCLAFVGYAQRQDGRALKVDIDLVLVNVSITNDDNQVVTDLKQEHFQLFEDKVEQEITYFSTDVAPVSLGIIFDVSHSMENKIDLDRLLDLIHQLRPPDRQLMLLYLEDLDSAAIVPIPYPCPLS